MPCSCASRKKPAASKRTRRSGTGISVSPTNWPDSRSGHGNHSHGARLSRLTIPGCDLTRQRGFLDAVPRLVRSGPRPSAPSLSSVPAEPGSSQPALQKAQQFLSFLVRAFWRWLSRGRTKGRRHDHLALGRHPSSLRQIVLSTLSDGAADTADLDTVRLPRLSTPQLRPARFRGYGPGLPSAP